MKNIEVSQAYQRGKRLFEAFQEFTSHEYHPLEIPSEVFVSWFGLQMRNVESKGTYMSYRQWLCLYLRHNEMTSLADKVKAIRFKGDEVKSKDARTSKLIQKSISKGQAVSLLTIEDLNKVFEVLRSKSTSSKDYNGYTPSKDATGFKYKYGVFLVYLIQLSAQTGLRPSEWCNATILKDITDDYGVTHRNVLKVRSALKGRVDSDKYRHLSLDGFTVNELAMLNHFIANISSMFKDDDSPEVSYKDLINKCGITMRSVSKRIYGEPGVIGTYAGRHLYAAELRRSGVNKTTLAAALGHSHLANQRYYGDWEKDSAGKRQTNWSLAHPLKSEILSVERYVNDRMFKSKARLNAYLRAERETKAPELEA